ncbi:MAG: hypothetical protein KDJ73_04410 [Notoacmeibacter sp.]|nr:hypothetical protein [Notoacmeibacter sp.]
MQRAALTLAMLLAAGGPCHASGGIDCTDTSGDVSVQLSSGHQDTLSIFRAVVTINGESWSSDTSVVPGAPLIVGQAFENDGMLLVDFLGESAGSVIASLRAFNATEEDTFVSAGVFTFKGKGAWAVDCSIRE